MDDGFYFIGCLLFVVCIVKIYCGLGKEVVELVD